MSKLGDANEGIYGDFHNPFLAIRHDHDAVRRIGINAFSGFSRISSD